MREAMHSRTTAPEELHDKLQERLHGLQSLLMRLGDDAGPSAVSPRELMQARSQTALSCRLAARLLDDPSGSGGWLRASPPADAFFDKPELLEHALSFLKSPAELARAGAVCSVWYLASRMHTLWEAQLRASGRLIGPDGMMLPMPREDEHTLFETAARIERYGGCRPINSALPPTLGKIDQYVDDLAGYEICSENTATVDAGGNQRVAGCGAVHCAQHHSRGRVTIRTLNAHHSRLYANQVSAGRPHPLARSAHLQPILQAIISAADPPTVHLVQPATHSTLELLSKLTPICEAHCHAIFCQIAHALHSLHEQAFCHGAVLISSILIRDAPNARRLPFAVLDHLHMCKPIAWASSASTASQFASTPAASGGEHTGSAAIAPTVTAAMTTSATTANTIAMAPTIAHAAAATASELATAPTNAATIAATSSVTTTSAATTSAATTSAATTSAATNIAASAAGSTSATTPSSSATPAGQMMMLTNAQPPAASATPHPQSSIERSGGGRSFAELIAWGWSVYDRLGTLTTGHPLDIDVAATSQSASLLAESQMAADVCDLGRLLLRLVLQPFKLRAQQVPPPAAGGGGVGAGAVGTANDPILLENVATTGTVHGELHAPPDPSLFAPSLQSLLLRMLHPIARCRPSMSSVLESEWVQEPHPGMARPLCICWKLADEKEDGAAMVAPSDLRLLQRAAPPLTQLTLANSAAVTDEWLETLAEQHATSLRRLDLSGCPRISSMQQPLLAIRKLRALEVLRLPAERWDEHELGETLTTLPNLRSVDASTHADLRKARDDLQAQCSILCNVRFGPR